MDKRGWRARARIETEGRAPDSASHCRHLERFLAASVADSRRVVVYDAMADEVDLGPLVAAHPDPGRRFAVTRTPEAGHALTLHPFGCRSERHRYGYRQPVADAPVVADEAIGAVLVPGLAFDRLGVRLGRGMGYYDRLLARLPADAILIGITGDYVVDGLPSEPFDVPMTHLATSEGVLAVPLDRWFGVAAHPDDR